MLKMTLIAAATAVALAGAAVPRAAAAAAAPAGLTEIAWKGGNQWNGPRHRGHKDWGPRRACKPIIRWKKVGYRHHRRWQPIVVGWNCGHRGHNDRNWKWH